MVFSKLEHFRAMAQNFQQFGTLQLTKKLP